MNVVRPPRRTPQVRPSRAGASLLDTDSTFESDLNPTSRRALGERRQARRARKRAAALADLPAAVPHDARRWIYISWRWVSALLTAVLIGVLFMFLSQNSFYVHSIYVGYTDSQHFLSVDYVYALTGLADMHIFWADADTIKRNLEADPQIASADVQIAWPSKIIVTITERQPALVWEQSGQRVWLDIRGRVMPLRQDLPDLVRVIVEKPSQAIHLGSCQHQGMDTVLGRGDCIDQSTVNGVLQFKAMYPNVTEVVYDPVKGLGFHEGGGWTLWFGDGVDIPTKMAVYNAIVAELAARNVQPIEINVANPDAPYYNAAPSS